MEILQLYEPSREWYNLSGYKKGRNFLWYTIKSAINDNSIVCDDFAKIRDYILFGNPLEANEFIKYGIILKYYICWNMRW